MNDSDNEGDKKKKSTCQHVQVLTNYSSAVTTTLLHETTHICSLHFDVNHTPVKFSDCILHSFKTIPYKHLAKCSKLILW